MKLCFLPWLFACVGGRSHSRRVRGATTVAVQQQSIVCVGHVPEDTYQCSSHSHSPSELPQYQGISQLRLFLTSSLRHNAADIFGHQGSRRPESQATTSAALL